MESENKMVDFATLNLDIKNDIKVFSINNQEIEVKQYLSLEDTNNLFAAAAQASIQGSVFNPAAYDAFFHLYLVMFLTNIRFSEEDLENLPEIYDKLASNGILDAVVKCMDQTLYNELLEFADELKEVLVAYQVSVAKVIDTIEQYAPNTAERISKELNDFDINKYEQVVNIARGAGAQI